MVLFDNNFYVNLVSSNGGLLLIFLFLWQPIVAVPSFMCADAFNKFLPFCTGFAAGCMIWMVVAEVLPDAFKVSALIASGQKKKTYCT